MKKYVFFLLAVLGPVLSFAQGCLTIFSEDGDRFYLSLNGVLQNNVPQANVRVDGLNNEFYSAKIVFEDKTKETITKNVPLKDAGTGQFAEMTFKIKKTKDGELKMRYFGSTPVPVNYNPPPDMYVVHYGQVQPAAPVATSVTQTTYATTTTAAPAGANMSINAGGMNMNVNVGDPSTGNLQMNVNINDPNAVQSSMTTTTRTTTTTTTSSDGGYDNAPARQPAQAGCSYPMAWNSFNDAKKTIEAASFEDTKLSTAKSVLSSNCVSTDQVVAICKLFTYEESKLDFAKYAFSKTTDQGNYFKVGTVFTYDASKTELNNFISNH